MDKRYKALAERAGLERDCAPNLVNQGPLVIPHPLTCKKSICTTESFYPATRKFTAEKAVWG